TPATLFNFIDSSDDLVGDFDPPAKVAFDPSGNLLLFGFARIWRMDIASGEVTRIAGTAKFGFSGAAGPATKARIAVEDAAVDSAGNILIGTGPQGRVRRIDAGTGIIDTIAGKGIGVDGNGKPDGTRFFSREGGPAIDSEISPKAIAFDTAGNLLIADGLDVLRVDASTQKITVIAGTGYSPNSIDGQGGNPLDDFTEGGLALQAAIGSLQDIKVDAAGNIFLAESDPFSDRIRRIDAVSGTITTYAGTCDPAQTGAASGCLHLLNG